LYRYDPAVYSPGKNPTLYTHQFCQVDASDKDAIIKYDQRVKHMYKRDTHYKEKISKAERMVA